MTEPSSIIDDPSRLSVRNRLSFLAKDSILYGGAAAFNKAFALITFPLLAQHFSVEDYGVIDFFSVLTNLFVIILVFGQDSAVARFFYEYKDTPRRQQVISQSILFQFGLVMLLLPLLWLFSDSIVVKLSQASEAKTLLKLVLLQVPFLLLINYSQNILKWTFARSQFLFISIGSTVFSMIALLVGLLGFDFGIVGVFVIYLGTRAIFGFWGMWLIRRWLNRPNEWKFIAELVRYAAPIGVICTISAFMPAMERTFIIKFLGVQELGLYSAGAKVAMLIALPIQAFQVAWGPFSLAIFKEDDASHTYNWVLKGFAVLILALTLFLAVLAAPIIQLLATNRYSGASVVVFAMSLGLAVESISWITAIGIGLSKKSYLSLYSYGTFLVISITSIYGLVQMFGLVGAAWGVMLGHLSKALTETWLAQRAYPLSWPFSEVASLLVVTVVIGGAGQLLISTTGPMAGSLVAGLGVPVVILFGWIVVFSADERSRMISLLRELRRPAVN